MCLKVMGLLPRSHGQSVQAGELLLVEILVNGFGPWMFTFWNLHLGPDKSQPTVAPDTYTVCTSANLLILCTPCLRQRGS